MATDSIREDYDKALQVACYNGREPVILLLAEHRPHLQPDMASLDLKQLSPEIVHTLNAAFGTEIEAVTGGKTLRNNKPFNHYVAYSNHQTRYILHQDHDNVRH